ncbi:MAG: hypothetical protein H7Z72_01990 [Bacteroidetes bacterium]|nr:hypothetical protein [Fibrella sp.]
MTSKNGLGLLIFIHVLTLSSGMAQPSKRTNELAVTTRSDTLTKAYDYFCTWRTQRMQLRPEFVKPGAVQRDFRVAMRDNLNETVLFGEQGWVTTLYPSVRKNLLFVLDYGWDVPLSTSKPLDISRFGGLIPDPDRFPSLVGTPAEKLRQLRERVTQAGWKGLGLWVAVQQAGEGDSLSAIVAEAESYWRERARWSRQAGIVYWKVDWGKHAKEENYRAMMTRVAREEAPNLQLEHAYTGDFFNDLESANSRAGGDAGGGRFKYAENGAVLTNTLNLLAVSDVLRTYDVAYMLAVSTTLDRVVELLKNNPGAKRTFLNTEDELYLSVVLHTALGVMRSPLPPGRMRLPYHNLVEVYQRNTEVLRAVNWRTLAPVVPAGQSSLLQSDTVLVDTWNFGVRPDQYNNLTVRQGAPAVISLNMPLPRVKTFNTPPPFVLASQHPNGAVAVATLPRTSVERGIHTPLADVDINLMDATKPVGVFGYYNSLTLTFPSALKKVRVMAQDLANPATKPEDITDRLVIQKNRIILPGTLIQQIGLSANGPEDLSEPGLILTFTR